MSPSEVLSKIGCVNEFGGETAKMLVEAVAHVANGGEAILIGFNNHYAMRLYAVALWICNECKVDAKGLKAGTPRLLDPDLDTFAEYGPRTKFFVDAMVIKLWSERRSTFHC